MTQALANAISSTTASQPPPRFTSPHARTTKMQKFDRDEFITNHVPTTGIIERLKKMKGPLFLLEVNPDEALDLLTLNDIGQNRNTKEKNIANYISEMKVKNFKYTGDTLKFSKSWKLLDGQNRLWAQWEAKVTLTYAVAVNLEEDTFAYIDSGAPRTAQDIVSIAGYKANRVQLSYAIKNILYFRKYKKLGASISGSLVSNPAVQKFTRNKNAMTNLLAYFGKAEIEYCKDCKFFTKPQWAALLYILHELPWHNEESKRKISTFAKKLSKGAELSEIDPIFKLRKVLENFEDMLQRGKTRRLANNVFLWKAKYFFNAWDKFITGEKSVSDLDPDENSEEISMPKTSKYKE